MSRAQAPMPRLPLPIHPSKSTRRQTWPYKGLEYNLDDFAKPRIVTLSDLNDSENPAKWTSRKKMINLILISIQGTLAPIASSLLAVANLSVALDFKLTDLYTPNLPVATFLIGLGIGPLYLAPCSEVYGRRLVFNLSLAAFTLINVGCALAPSIAALSVMRFFSGLFGSAGPGIGSSIIADMYPREKRGKAQAIYNFGPTSGPILGGLFGSFIIAGTGSWRWMMWLMVIFPGATTIASALIIKETYAPYLIKKKAQLIERKSGRKCNAFISKKDAPMLLRNAIIRPIKMLTQSPICMVMSLYMSLIYGILYLRLVTLPLLYGPVPKFGLFCYKWNYNLTGLAYLGPGIGMFAGTAISILYMNRSYKWMAKRATRNISPEVALKNAKVAQPEFRIPFMLLGMIIVPVGNIIFAWSAEGELHWSIPLIGAAIGALGTVMAYTCIQSYMVDAFEKYAASALATMTVCRSVMGCVFSIIGFELYRSLGYGWGTMVVSFICIAMIPIPIGLYYYGPRLRKHKLSLRISLTKSSPTW
ncbi:MAG: hypothetical protein M4579_002997 [Chaenotheca gracillima]|nr:MAG: hypothetical protein M4579_002997 [Chaenotheca gracillima]